MTNGKEGLEVVAAVAEGGFEERGAVVPEEVVGGEGDGDLGAEEEVVAVASEAFLELGKGKGAAVAASEEFAVEDDIGG